MHGTIESVFRVEWRPLAELGAVAAEWRALAALRARTQRLLRAGLRARGRAGVRARCRRRPGLVAHDAASPARFLSGAHRTPALRHSAAGADRLDTSVRTARHAARRSRDSSEPVIAAWLDHVANNPHLPKLMLLPYFPVDGRIARTFDTRHRPARRARPIVRAPRARAAVAGHHARGLSGARGRRPRSARSCAASASGWPTRAC